MTLPARTYLIHMYWLNGMSIKKIAARYNDVSADCISRLFKKYGILVRATGGRGHRVGRSATVNRVRLELMLMPSVDEWRAMRPWRVLRDELEWLAREARG